jgi:AcrR family transcriptional regulator
MANPAHIGKCRRATRLPGSTGPLFRTGGGFRLDLLPPGTEPRASNGEMSASEKAPAMEKAPMEKAPMEKAGPQRQTRGRLRIEKILDAADLVIRRQDAVDVSLQEVAKEAALPPASLYHYFSTSQSLLMELARRYHAAFEALAMRRIDHGRLTHWGDLCVFHADLTLRFYHEHPVAMRLFLGPEAGWEVRAADLATNRRIGSIYYRKLVQHFVVAPSRVLEDAFDVSVTISDAIWAMSFARSGAIEPDMAAEALRARLAYLRLYVGEFVEKRPAPIEF